MSADEMFRLRQLHTRWATAENPQARRGAGGRSGGGRKGAPCVSPWTAGSSVTLLNQAGRGMIRRIWCTIIPDNPLHLRNCILRMWWDHQATPSVEVPLGDFFGVAHGRQVDYASDLTAMQSGRGLNCWIPMPFARHARIEIENDTGEDLPFLFYEVDFTLGDAIDASCGYFHAAFVRANPCPLGEDFTVLSRSGVQGVFLGAVVGVRSCSCGGWWGEGETKVYIDDDVAFPTLVGTGVEDWVGSAWGLERCALRWQGAPLVDKQAGLYSLYRWHVPDPVYFRERIRVTIQQIGFGQRSQLSAELGAGARFLPAAGVQSNPDNTFVERSDDWSAMACWYEGRGGPPLRPLPDRAARSADLMAAGTTAAIGRADQG